MGADGGNRSISRRTLLAASAGTVGVFGTGSASAVSDDHSGGRTECPEATFRPKMVHYDDAPEKVCADDHPVTQELQQSVRRSLETKYPTVGSLIGDGFIPYFDYVTSDGDSGVSHWLSPEFLSDDTILDPARPESVLVDHASWRPIATMFIATRRGEPVDAPPPIYGDEHAGDQCLPWHTHVGVPGRSAWWKYRLLYEDGFDEVPRRLPCRTPWMMHVWAYSHPEGIYAHDPPPPGERGVPAADRAGFETDAVPGEDELEWEMLPESLKQRVAHR